MCLFKLAAGNWFHRSDCSAICSVHLVTASFSLGQVLWNSSIAAIDWSAVAWSINLAFLSERANLNIESTKCGFQKRTKKKKKFGHLLGKLVSYRWKVISWTWIIQFSLTSQAGFWRIRWIYQLRFSLDGMLLELLLSMNLNDR